VGRGGGGEGGGKIASTGKYNIIFSIKKKVIKNHHEEGKASREEERQRRAMNAGEVGSRGPSSRCFEAHSRVSSRPSTVLLIAHKDHII